jgi:transcriptional regulator with XRE-family HTH domain
MVDALEAGIAALRSHDGNGVARDSNAISPDVLRREMSRCGVSLEDVAAVTGMERDVVSGWLNGSRATPEWVLAFIRLTAELPVPARRRLGRQTSHPMVSRADVRSHPFARIEEL